MRSPPWVFIDISYLAYRALSTVGHLEMDGSPTGVIFGLFTQLKQICTDPHVQSNRLGLFFDSRYSYRRDAHPFYKEKRRAERKEDPEKLSALKTLWEQVNVCYKTIFPAIGIPCYRQVGIESDDLLMSAAMQMNARGERCVVVTADGDLYQAIRDWCHWFDPGRSKYYTPETFEADRGIDPALWGKVKTLAGCHGDNVPGIKGIGEVTAIKYLLGTLPPSKKATWAKIRSDEGKKTVQRNAELVVLPHKQTQKVKLREPEYNAKEFFAVCKKYGLLSFMGPQKKQWESFFHSTRTLGIHGMLRKRMK